MGERESLRERLSECQREIVRESVCVNVFVCMSVGVSWTSISGRLVAPRKNTIFCSSTPSISWHSGIVRSIQLVVFIGDVLTVTTC